MATYQKRGYKPKTKEEVEEVVQEESTTAEVFSSLDEGASRTEAWVEKNQKPIFIGIAAICFFKSAESICFQHAVAW